MARKVVKVYLTPEQKRILQRLCHSLGMAESEVLRHAFMDYAKSVSLVTEKVHGKLRGVDGEKYSSPVGGQPPRTSS